MLFGPKKLAYIHRLGNLKLGLGRGLGLGPTTRVILKSQGVKLC